jgi:hypothetical protein
MSAYIYMFFDVIGGVSTSAYIYIYMFFDVTSGVSTSAYIYIYMFLRCEKDLTMRSHATLFLKSPLLYSKYPRAMTFENLFQA